MCVVRSAEISDVDVSLFMETSFLSTSRSLHGQRSIETEEISEPRTTHQSRTLNN